MGKIRKVILISMIIPVILLSMYEPAKAASRFEDIIARSALLAEVDSGRLLFEHNADLSQPVGDFAKVMTLLLAIEAIENNQATPQNIITMTETAWEDIGPNSTTRNIQPGEEMTLLDLMYSAYVGNANEANNMIAEYLAGSIEAFVRLMNSRAAEIGAENTTFVNPHGQYDSRQYTTANDLFLIFREAVNNELFLEISGTIRHVTSETNLSAPRRLINNNSLLNQSGRHFYRHLVTGATSSLFEGGYSFIGYAQSDGLSLISVILGSTGRINEDGTADLSNLTESRRLLDWGFNNWGMRTIISTTDLIARVPVLHGAGADFVILRPESSLILLMENASDDFERRVIVYSEMRNETLVAPIRAGTVLGEVIITHNDQEFNILLIANTNIELHRFQLIRMQILDTLSTPLVRNIIIALALLVALYITLVVRYNIIRRKRLLAIKRNKQRIMEERQRKSTNDIVDEK